MKKTVYFAIISLFLLRFLTFAQTQEVPHIQIGGLGGHINTIAFSADGKKIVTGSLDNTARIWDVESGREALKLEEPKKDAVVYSATFSPDGKRIASGRVDGLVQIWDAESGKERQKMEGHSGCIYSVAFSPDGKKIVTGSAGQNPFLPVGDGTARIWDVETGKELLKLTKFANIVTSVTFSPDGKKVATAGINEAGMPSTRIWDAESGKELLKLEGHGGFSCSIAFFPDGKRLITGGNDRPALIWDTESGKELQRLTHSDGIRAVAFSPDGEKIITGGQHGIARIWDAESGKELRTLTGHGNHVPPTGHKGGVNAVVFSPDGKKVATGGADNTVIIWTLEK